MNYPIRVGQEYRRKTDIHEKYGGNRQSGISTSATQPFIFLFTGEGGEQHGYSDGFDSQGLYLYTGEGQLGDMTFTRGNEAILKHTENRRTLLLFEQTRKAHCRFVGEARCIGYKFQTRPDRESKPRKAIVFELALLTASGDSAEVKDTDSIEPLPPPSMFQKLTVSELKTLASHGHSQKVKPRTTVAQVYYRSQAVKRYALARAQGVCEACNLPAPFKTSSGEPYLEVHHLTRIADGGPDLPEQVAAICANCHRRAHYSSDSKSFNTIVSKKVAHLESTRPTGT